MSYDEFEHVKVVVDGAIATVTITREKALNALSSSVMSELTHIAGELDTVTASMAKYWITDTQGKIIDRCLQLFGGYGYMEEYPTSRMYRDARVMRIYAGTNEIMKVLIARSL